MKMRIGHWASWLAASLLAIGTAHAAENILVACWHEDEHWVTGGPDERNHRCEQNILNAALPAFTTQLRTLGFGVYDGSVVRNLVSCMTQGSGCSHSGLELIEIANTYAEQVDRPIDVVVKFSVRSNGFNGKPLTFFRVQGDLWDTHSHRSLGSFKAEGGSNAVASQNEIKCAGKKARECAELLAQDVAHQIAKDRDVQLGKKEAEAVASSASNDCRSSKSEYTLKFHGFTDLEVRDIRDHLVIFDGYCRGSNDLRLIEGRPNYMNYLYYSSLDMRKLDDRLRIMLDKKKERGGVETKMERSRTTFNVTKKN